MSTNQVAELSFPARFEVMSRLGEGGMGVVYEVFDHETRSPYAVKTLRKMAPEQLYWLKNEFRKLSGVHHPNLVQLGELHAEAGHCFFTMELVRGRDFRSHVRGRTEPARPSLEDDATPSMSHASPDSYFTRAGVTGDPLALVTSPSERGRGRYDEAKLRSTLRQLADAIVALHGHGLVHRDLKPSNVMVDDTGRVVVLDFGLADTRSRSDNDNADGIYGTAAYMAPEQAQKGAVGPASDWYAFGAMLFNALTGRLPFEGPSAAVLKAKAELEAPRVRDLVPDCPEDLDELCSALLATSPDERHDGQEVLERLSQQTSPGKARSRGNEELFVGRSEELAQLTRGLAAVEAGRFSAWLVEGEPGVGKTELVEHFFEVARRDQPLLVLRGRCYEQEFVPFKGVDALVDSLSRHLKSLRAEEVFALLPPRLNLVAALFPVLYRVRAVADVVPPIEVNEAKAEHRSEAIAQFGQLLSNLARRTRLVLFIDDLQWAGADSFALLRAVCGGPDAPPLLLLGTCRTSDRWEQSDATGAVQLDGAFSRMFERIRLESLSSEEASRLVHHHLRDVDEARVSQLLAEASGHPLFLKELARYALSRGEVPRDLRLDEVLRERIARLDPAPRKLLEATAIAGVPLPARVLARVADISRAESVRALRLLRAEQLVRTETGGDGRAVEPYHDRIREAVVEGMKSGRYVASVAKDLASTHLALARQLQRARSDDDVPVASTTIANHFNLGEASIRSEADHREALERNLEAARSVKLGSAYDAAVHYLAAARRHLPALPGDERRVHGRAIDLLAMEVSYLSHDEAGGHAAFERLVRDARGDLELAQAYETRIMVETAQNQLARAVSTAREGLERLAMRFPAKGHDLLLLRDMARFELRLWGRAPDTLLALPVTSDERVRAQMQVLMAMTPAAFFSDPALMSIAMVRMATLSLDGLTELSAYGFIGYALVLCAGFQKYRRGFAFSKLANALNERFQNRALDAKLAHLHHFNCGSYSLPFAECKAGLKRAQELGLKNGDLNFRTYGAVCTPMITLTGGEPLDVMRRECAEGVRVADQEGNIDMAAQTRCRLRAIRCLTGENPSPLRMDGEDGGEAAFLHDVEERELPTANFTFGLFQAVLGVHFDDPRLALAGAERAKRFGHAQFGLITHVDLTLYETLAACSIVEAKREPRETRRLRKLARTNLPKLAKWADAHAQNFGCHHPLAAGELARVTGQPARARTYLLSAVGRAESQGVHNLAGLAHERLAALARASGDPAGARRELTEALAAYRRWGAAACAARVDALLHHPPE